jgi:hypothetical protein
MSRPDADTIIDEVPNPPGSQAKTHVGRKIVFALVVLVGSVLIIVASGLSAAGIASWVVAMNEKETRRAKEAEAAKKADQPRPNGMDDLSQEVSTDKPEARNPLAEAFTLAESTYPNDYRFPYEHAKLTVTGSSHHHAFGLLFIAGERAIDAGKADQLLADLDKQKDAAFSRCSKGHAEWDVLQKALKAKDKEMLATALATMHRDLIGGADDMTMPY